MAVAFLAALPACSLCGRRCYACGLLRGTRLPVPVVVVGNLYVGGTGKTPLVEWSRRCARGWTPGVVSRGYGRTANDIRLVATNDDASTVGDEPLLIAQAGGVPVAVGADRAAAARGLLDTHADCDLIVADDGLQHLRLARDVEIAVLDERGLGNGWVLPAGPLREPARALQPVSMRSCCTQQTRAGLCLSVSRPRTCAVPHAFAARAAARKPGRSRQHAAAGRSRAAAAARPGARCARCRRHRRATALLRNAARAGLAVAELPLDHHDFRHDTFAGSRDGDRDHREGRRNAAIDLRGDDRIWIAPLQADVDSALVDLIAARLTSLRKAHDGPAPA